MNEALDVDDATQARDEGARAESDDGTDERVVAVVPARGGSKSVPGKNLKHLGGKPLLAWSIEVAHAVDAVDRVLVSTDDEQIAAVAREYGAEVVERPVHLAEDNSLVIDALRHVRDWLVEDGDDATVVAMLEPTCPFRATEDVARCLDHVFVGRDSAATFVESEINPHRAWTLGGEVDRPTTFVEDADPWLPRQSLPETYRLNGGAYVFRLDALPDEGRSLLFGEYGAVVMPPERSVDIDTELDFALAETVLASQTE
ncbi:cytidylyltransferase domain-containing protein [Halobium salinum]|uniref:Cytidylyltransferase domain-containing protein n=1 Tax=Halobium salinum TaxID=1364940 RepID=A0ABD5P9W3_9EURY|nr:acylneuraminate cytidylyltransferase family protein [Halobium salinum]